MDEHTERASAIDWHARDAAIEREKEGLDRANPITGWNYRITRFFVRTGRLAIGLALLILSLLIFGNGPSISDTPFASLTLGGLFGAVASVLFGFLVLYWAFVAAFGAKPDPKERHRQDAIQNVDTRARHNGCRY